jgi:hypothetical protein
MQFSPVRLNVLFPRRTLSPHDIITFVFCKTEDCVISLNHAYSNFGYMLLGEIIARKQGNSYERYIQQRFGTNGIKGMRLAGNYTWDRRPLGPLATIIHRFNVLDGNHETISKPCWGNDSERSVPLVAGLPVLASREVSVFNRPQNKRLQNTSVMKV